MNALYECDNERVDWDMNLVVLQTTRDDKRNILRVSYKIMENMRQISYHINIFNAVLCVCVCPFFHHSCHYCILTDYKICRFKWVTISKAINSLPLLYSIYNVIFFPWRIDYAFVNYSAHNFGICFFSRPKDNYSNYMVIIEKRCEILASDYPLGVSYLMLKIKQFLSSFLLMKRKIRVFLMQPKKKDLRTFF